MTSNFEEAGCKASIPATVLLTVVLCASKDEAIGVRVPPPKDIDGWNGYIGAVDAMRCWSPEVPELIVIVMPTRIDQPKEGA